MGCLQSHFYGDVMEAYEPLLPFLDNAGASVLFLVFLYLWHKRTTRRDADNAETVRALLLEDAETIKALLLALMECTKGRMDS